LQECLIRELYEEFSVVVKEQHIEIFESFEAMAA
jgi:8-oxo-dGTP pyrophosphatase MutT (NUDIX family)